MKAPKYAWFLFLGILLALGTTAEENFYWIPVAAHTDGQQGSSWRTDLTLINACAVPLPVEVRFHTPTGTRTSAFVVGGRSQRVLHDVIGELAPDGALGPLEIRVDGELIVDARTYNEQATGRPTQTYPTLAAGDGFGTGDVLVLPMLHQTAANRTNLGVLNMGGESAAVTVTLKDGDGSTIGSYQMSVGPRQLVFDQSPFQARFGRSNVTDGYAVLTVESGSAVYPFASVVGSTGGYASSVLPQQSPACPVVTSQALDPTFIPQFKDALVIPPVLAPDADTAERTDYSIAVREFEQRILPDGFPSTTVWSYGRAEDPLPGSGEPSSFNYPAFTIEATVNKPVRVTWINDLTAQDGTFIPHRLPIDPTLHWANPPGPRDGTGDLPFREPYDGPVPIVTHVHGAHVPSHSDGYPEAWFLPDATNIPEGYFTEGTHYGGAAEAPDGAAIFEYPNDQRPTTLWYHDHTLGITRLNVYMGMAGFWLLRDHTDQVMNLPGPAPALGDPPGQRYYEIPLAIQDKTFETDGSLFYPDSRAFFDDYDGPFVPETEVHPIWNPEFFGDTIVVNGRTWPYLDVEPRLYRLRLLNGSNSRFLILKFDHEGLEFHQIGNDGGYLTEGPLTREQILLAPAQRADVIVDFSSLQPGETVTLLNLGPDEPYRGTLDFEPADPATTGRVMQFRSVALTGEGVMGSIPATLPSLEPLESSLPPRDLTLHELLAGTDQVPAEALLGTAEGGTFEWDEEITELPGLGDTEIWRIMNLTGDAHPIHLHLVQFEVLDRTPFDAEAYAAAQKAWLDSGKSGVQPRPDDYVTGPARPRDPWEKGRIDTVTANPGEITRLAATFDLAGLFVWHCHILEHEDNEMMRPFLVTMP